MKVTAYSLLKQMFITRWQWRGLILLCSFCATMLGLLGPYLQKEYLDLLLGHRAESSFEFMRGQAPWLLMFLSFFSVAGYLGIYLLGSYIGAKEALYMQTQYSRALYDKILELRMDAMEGRPVGEFVATYATDIPGATILLEQSLPQGASVAFPLILAPWALHNFFGVPILPLSVIMTSIIGLNFFMAFRQSRYFLQFKQLAAERIGIVAEWIQNIRTLRILGWVEAFEEKIHHTRVRETKNRVTMVTNGQVMNSFASSVTFILNILVILTLLSYTTEPITAGTLFALLWIVGVFLTRPFRQMPWVFTFVFDGWTSLRRLATFLNLKNSNHRMPKSDWEKIPELDAKETILRIENLNLKIGRSEILKSVDLSVKRGEFVAIVGEVGAGKSLLLMSLMGESGCTHNKYTLHGGDANQMPAAQLRQFFTYIPQEGFIMSATLRDNVAFTYDTSREKDAEILQSLKLAQFNLDVERITDGLETEIGERGVNLSGGQKQRVSLARVDYYPAPIVLVDDGLSAVDVETEDKLIEDLFKGSWKNRTRIIVTHRLSVLEDVDRVLFMESGRIIAEGTFHDLLRHSVKFQAFAATAVATQGKTPPALVGDLVTTLVPPSEDNSDG